jgi:hypothetical protein
MGAWLALSALGLGACATGDANSADPLATVQTDRVPPHRRVAAAVSAWDRVLSGESIGQPERDVLRRGATSPAWPPAVRTTAIDLLLDDPDPAAAAQTRSLLLSSLPREPAREVVDQLSTRAAAGEWHDAIEPLLRRLALPERGVRDRDRAEWRALRSLLGRTSVEQAAFDLFLSPSAPVAGDDAWNLLARLDPDGSVRARMISHPREVDSRDLADLRAALADLRTVPVTLDELRWLRRLREPASAPARAWWADAASAIALLRDDEPAALRMRHAEPLRWTAAHRPQRLSLGRDELLSQLESRLDGRTFYRRLRSGGAGPLRDRLAEQRDRLSWGDLVAILAIDDALRDPRVADALLAQAEMDMQDRQSEYGGVIDVGGPAPAAILFLPRAAARQGDRQYVAPPELIPAADRALAVYHFHAQQTENADEAGPSAADLADATLSGRSCLVLTSVRRGVLAADWFGPFDVVVDLGEVRHARASDTRGTP